MQEMIKKELETLLLMARNWKKGYEGWIESSEDLYVAEEFRRECRQMMRPYVRRLREISGDEVDSGVWTWFGEKLKEVGDELEGDIRDYVS